MKKFMAAAAVVALVVVGGVLFTLFVGTGLSQQAPTSCVGPAVGTVEISDDMEVAGFRGEQLENAATIMRVAGQQGLDVRGQTVVVMTAMAESSLINMDHGDAVRNDTIGLFQTGPEWGSYEERMDPAGATALFIERLTAVDGWEGLPPTIAAYRAQRNDDPLHYEKYWEAAVEVVSALADEVDEAGVEAGAAAGTSYDIGQVRPQTQALADEVGQRFELEPSEIGGYRESAVDANGHPAGLAVDFMTYEDRALGDEIVSYVIANAERLSVDYIIWKQAVWYAADAEAGWEPMADRGSETANHLDHPHVNLLPTPNESSGLGSLACLNASLGGSAGAGLPSGTWTQPLDAGITSVYGPRWGAFHAGTDFGAPCGTPFVAASDGVVVYAGGPYETYGLTGHVIVIDHGDGVETTYNHMFAWGLGVRVGDRVSAGQSIGLVGTDGNSTGCHLHFGVYLNGQHTDPEPFMAGLGVPLG